MNASEAGDAEGRSPHTAPRRPPRGKGSRTWSWMRGKQVGCNGVNPTIDDVQPVVVKFKVAAWVMLGGLMTLAWVPAGRKVL